MRNLDLISYGVQEMNAQEIKTVEGGGEWSWGEAAFCYMLLGPLGVGFYYLGTQQ